LCDDAALLDGVDKRLVVTLLPVGVPLRDLGERPI
jgi:hypothetical protein